MSNNVNYNRKKMNKIYDKIDKLAVNGKEYIHEYHKYIDELIEKGDYNYLELTLFYFYFIDINAPEYTSISDVKNKTWDKILFQTNSTMSKKIKKIFDNNGLYQIGYDIFKSNNNDNIGQIIELEQYSPDTKYYLQNKEYAKLIGLKVTYLQVTRYASDLGPTSSIIIDKTLQNTTEDNNLINRYKLAVKHLLNE